MTSGVGWVGVITAQPIDEWPMSKDTIFLLDVMNTN